MVKHKFAVIKLWPKIKAAEDECIARLKIAAKSLDLECVEVDSLARLLHPPHTQLTKDDVDFVLSLHFETPKCYDVFSFVALWNPLQFFHEWGYRKFTSHLLTHDDFLSCSSVWADDHVRRILSSDPMRDGPYFHIYHSLSEPLFGPTLGKQKVFYTGINWEHLGKKPARHQKLLRLLDGSGILRIYGPKLFQGIDVWAGYKSYVGSVPFDGISIVREINKAGIALVLSSEAHAESELMSNRLFESLAAGALVVCDDNAFARRFFGDTLLYIDTTLPANETYAQVQSHVDWIKSHPEQALEKAKRAQEIFRDKFTLKQCLKEIYDGLPARKEKLERLYTPKRPYQKISLLFLMPEFNSDLLEQHISSCLAQKNVEIHPMLVMSRPDMEFFRPRVQTRLKELAFPIAIEAVDFFDLYPNGSVRRRERIGKVISEAIDRLVRDDYFCIVGPNEQLFSDHLCSLLRVLQECDAAGVACSNILLSSRANGEDHMDFNDELNLDTCAPVNPLGFGRFLFRMSALKANLQTTLPYLDALALHVLVCNGAARTKRSTLILDVQDPFNLQFGDSKPLEEREILIDYAPAVFGKRTKPTEFFESFERLEPLAKTTIAVELAHSVPFPTLLSKMAFGLYRKWLKRKR